MNASAMLRDLRDDMLLAAIRAPKEPPRTLLRPVRARWKRILLAIPALALTGGLMGGAIALYIAGWKVTPIFGVLAGPMQVVPMLVAVRWPLVAWRITGAALVTADLAMISSGAYMPWPVTSVIAQAIIVFLVAAGHDRRVQLGVGALLFLAVVLPAVLISGTPFWVGMLVLTVLVLAMVFGDAVGGRWAAEESLAAESELRRQDLARHAVLEERARIARELHDVVAHHMSVIALQAEAAPYKIPDLPPAAQATFEVVRDAAREALAETRRVVGLLRQDEEAERLPQPGLDRLEDLVEQASRSGLTISAAIVGMPRPLSVGVDLSAFRIIQESLSNASRYAPGATVKAEIHYGPDTLTIRVRDDGPRGVPEQEGGGHGIVGMRERAAMLGGHLSAGATDGGWTVEATLPYGDAP